MHFLPNLTEQIRSLIIVISLSLSLSLLTRGCVGDGEKEAVGGPAQDEQCVADRTAESPSAAASSIFIPRLLLSKMSSAVAATAAPHGAGNEARGDLRLRETLTHSGADAGNVSRRHILGLANIQGGLTEFHS